MWDAIVLFQRKPRKVNRLERKIGGGSVLPKLEITT